MGCSKSVRLIKPVILSRTPMIRASQMLFCLLMAVTIAPPMKEPTMWAKSTMYNTLFGRSERNSFRDSGSLKSTSGGGGKTSEEKDSSMVIAIIALITPASSPSKILPIS
jgi:hypothetical protein